jgi:hypothetical protein
MISVVRIQKREGNRGKIREERENNNPLPHTDGTVLPFHYVHDIVKK